jgi:hypothetical protein
MTKYIVRASRSLEYAFLVEANSKEEAGVIYEKLASKLENLVDINVGGLESYWNITENDCDAKVVTSWQEADRVLNSIHSDMELLD